MLKTGIRGKVFMFHAGAVLHVKQTLQLNNACDNEKKSRVEKRAHQSDCAFSTTNFRFLITVHLPPTGCNQLNGGWRYTWTFMSDLISFCNIYHAAQSRWAWRVHLPSHASAQPGHVLLLTSISDDEIKDISTIIEIEFWYRALSFAVGHVDGQTGSSTPAY